MWISSQEPSCFGGFKSKTQKLLQRLLMPQLLERGLRPKRIALSPLMLGTLLSLAQGCRSSQPPPIDICLGDGFGGADCTLSDGSHAYKTPSQLKNSWIIPDQKQAASFTGWCYDIPSDQAQAAMEKISLEARL
jgi:hypothetical protein